MGVVMQVSSLKNHLLIAMPSLNAGFFSQSVTFLCEHDEHGAMGIVLNKPLEFELEHVLAQLDIPCSPAVGRLPVLSGGPVQPEHGFILHSYDGTIYDSTLAVSDEIALTTSLDIMQAIGHSTGPQEFTLALGYAGWGSGQLEQEISDNSWLTVPASPELVFNTRAADLVRLASLQLGIDIHLMPTRAGHA